MNPRDNPADIAAEIIKKRAAEAGQELADDFDERVAEWRAYMEEPISEDPGERCVQEWTTEYPTKPGYYWVRNMLHRSKRLDAEPKIVDVIPEYPPEFGPSDMEFYFSGRDVRWDREDLISAEWYGPLQAPE
jgi:hypothetical protein